MRGSVLAVVVCVSLLGSGRPAPAAPTWVTHAEACRLCGKELQLDRPASYGSYIYRWSSKFQLVFWPDIEERSLWSCRECKLTCFMADWEEVKPEHHERLRAALKDLKREAADDYRQVPVLERLEAARKVYEVLGRTPEQWCRFHRVVGYHAARQGQPERAKEARRKALELALELIEEAGGKGRAKEHEVAAAAMLRLLGEPDQAKAHLDAAAPLKIEGDDAERARGMTEYLDELIAEMRQKLAANDLSDDGRE